MRKFLFTILFLFSLFYSGFTGRARAQNDWIPSGILPMPHEAYSFLTSTPAGDILAATYNNQSPKDPPRALPVYLIKNPTAFKPLFTTLIKHEFSGQRGYGGLCCDEQGNIYLSADTGDAATCFVRKFRPDGQPDVSFGNNGEIKPNRRCLGLDVLGNYLILAVDWAEIQVYNSSNGTYMNSLPRAPFKGDQVFVRDIAIEPASLRILGVAAGSVVAWEGGTPWNPQNYKCRIIAKNQGVVRSGEGISIDPILQCALVTPVPGNKILEVYDEDRIRVSSISTALEDTHLVDSVVSFDGAFLFVSDLIGTTIHVLKRDPGKFMENEYALSAESPSPAAQTTPVSPAEESGWVQWRSSYLEVLEAARSKNAPMIIYFRKDKHPPCEELENRILLTKEFNVRARNFYCVFEDVSVNRLLAYRFGVFRVPSIVALDGQGGVAARFVSEDIKAADIYRVMDALGKR